MLITTAVSYAGTSDPDWSAVTSWVGKYPSEAAGKNSQSLLAQPIIAMALRKILPKAELTSLKIFKVEIPVRVIDGLVVVNKCLPHNCPADMATVVIDVGNRRLWAGFFSREEGHVSTRWYGMDDDYSVLPASVKSDFQARHGD